MQDDHVNQLIRQASDGNQEALEEVWPQLYSSIREIAARQMARESNRGVLQTTAIVHEAYFRLRDQERTNWNSQTHFLATASIIMRRILVDAARHRKAQKRGGKLEGQRVSETALTVCDEQLAVLEIHEALEKLQQIAADAASILEMSSFGGMTVPQIAESMDISASTVDRRLRFARAWLRQHLLEESA